MDAKFFPQTAEMLRFLPETILTIAGTLLLLLATNFPKQNPLPNFPLNSVQLTS